jgi:hypothetical protein
LQVRQDLDHVLFVVSPISTVSERSSVRPACSSVASWRVTISMSLADRACALAPRQGRREPAGGAGLDRDQAIGLELANQRGLVGASCSPSISSPSSLTAL